MTSIDKGLTPTLTDVVALFGAIPVSRLHSTCGTRPATVDDVIAIHDRENRLCELVGGLLVEKEMGTFESMIAAELIMILGQFVRERDLGRVLGEAGMLQLCPGLVRIPDVSFISRERLSTVRFEQAVWQVAPELAIEVLSAGNTCEEMDRKLQDYFANGVIEVWYVDPARQLISIYDSVSTCRVVEVGEHMSHSSVLVGLKFDITRLFVKPA